VFRFFVFFVFVGGQFSARQIKAGKFNGLLCARFQKDALEKQTASRGQYVMLLFYSRFEDGGGWSG